nr:c-type cytochrome [Acidovorax sp. SRB_24]
MAAAAPDALRGEQVYARCLACHALAYDRVGPHHCGLLGRRAGSVPGFAYSDAMKKSGLVWDEKTLDLFLRKPLALVPGSSMAYDGVPDASERSDLIAYLRQAGQSPQCRPQAKDGAGPKSP